jgi:hypothetical protein
MFNFASSLRIYLCLDPTDMRKSFNGLYAIARHELERDPMDGSLFVFANRRRDRIKLLYWDGTGFWVLAKRQRTCLHKKIDAFSDYTKFCAAQGKTVDYVICDLWNKFSWKPSFRIDCESIFYYPETRL